ncbi:hypothetical protein [Nonomuraea sp. NPDC049695]|uniref:hypothetical protein n=1 Tax=Nonomuraea sp. NPDC049695 TaxID=3154734 RepID=UPI00342DADCF
MPYSDHCRVLEAMFPGKTAKELFSTSNGTEAPPPRREPDPVNIAYPGWQM